MGFKSNVSQRIAALKLIGRGRTLEDKTRILIGAIIMLIPRRLISKIARPTINKVIKGTLIKRGRHYFCLLSVDNYTQISEPFEREIQHWFQIPEGGIFLDVGANIGLYTVKLSEMVGSRGRVVAFEPCWDAFECLHKTILANNLDNVVSFPYALWKENTEKRLFLKIHQGSNSIVEPEDSFSSELVFARAFDKLALSLNLERIDLVKIDVEGAEREVLMGMRDSLIKHSPRLIIEVRDDNIEWIRNYLYDIDYRVKGFWDANKGYCYMLFEVKKR